VRDVQGEFHWGAGDVVISSSEDLKTAVEVTGAVYHKPY
jgi:hypothetical protein